MKRERGATLRVVAASWRSIGSAWEASAAARSWLTVACIQTVARACGTAMQHQLLNPACLEPQSSVPVPVHLLHDLTGVL